MHTDDEVFVPVGPVWEFGSGSGNGRIRITRASLCRIKGKPGEMAWVPLSVLEQQAQNRTGTEQESATPPSGSATDGAGDAAKPLE